MPHFSQKQLSQRTRNWQAKTQHLSYLGRLIQMRLRIWASPLWPLKEEWYRETPVDPWSGDATVAHGLINHVLELEDQLISSPEGLWGQMESFSTNIQSRYYEFKWLRDLSTAPSSQNAAHAAHELWQSWHDCSQEHSLINERISVRAERLANCFCYHHLLAENATEKEQRQLKHFYYSELLMLADVMRRRGARTGLSVIKALIYGALLMPSAAFLLEPVSKNLMRAIQSRFYEDGGHKTRSPEYQRRDVTRLMEIRATMKKRQFPMPAHFDESLQQRLDALATMSHRDGKLACFHNSTEQSIHELMNLWQVWRKPRPLPQKTLEKSRYMHVVCGDSTVIFDANRHVPHHPHHHAGPLAFEFSRNQSRMIVNCGAYRGSDAMWREVAHQTAAHSTLSLDKIDAWDALAVSTRDHLTPPSFDASEESIIISANHGGYVGLCGMVHQRELEISQDGELLKGIDRLICVDKQRRDHRADSIDFVYARFHLHPTIEVEKMTPREITLKLDNGELWHFASDDDAVSLGVEEGVYLGIDGLPKPSLQIAIALPLEKHDTLELPWSLRKAERKLLA